MRFLILLTLAATLFGQNTAPQADNDPLNGWIALGSKGSLAIDREPGHTRSGSAALAFRYDLGSRQPSIAVRSGDLSGMSRIHFWIRTDHSTPVALMLSERKPGGNYAAWFWARANEWQEVELSPSDFTINDGPNDPPDPDGKLDLNDVEGLGIVDLAYFFGQLPENSELPVIIDRASGVHTLWLDGFRIVAGTPESGIVREGAVPIGSFARGLVGWLTLGGMDLRPAGGSSPVKAASLEVSYKTTSDAFPVLVRRAAEFDLTGVKRLAFDIASDHEVTLALSVEVKKAGSAQGPRYQTTIMPPAGRRVFHVDVSLADFEHDSNSPADPAGRLDPARIKSISFADVTALAGGAPGENRIWIANLEGRK